MIGMCEHVSHLICSSLTASRYSSEAHERHRGLVAHLLDEVSTIIVCFNVVIPSLISSLACCRYWLYAAVRFRCVLVTNDEMRDHLFSLLGNDFFPKWKERHQVVD